MNGPQNAQVLKYFYSLLEALSRNLKMGNKQPTLQTIEESNWKRPHELLYNIALREEQIKLLENFTMGENLKICFFKTETFPDYQQFFVSNGSWIIQFGKENEIKENLGNLTPSSKLKICIISFYVNRSF